MNVDHPTVPAEVFNAAAAQEEAALAAYQSAQEQQQEAAHVLKDLSCCASFTYEVPGPYADDVAVIEDECALPADHGGQHHEDFRLAQRIPRAYNEAAKRYSDAEKQASRERGHWQDADEALNQLRCNQEDSAVWPCVKRRGHTGEHQHPTGMRLVL